jgi:bifunctional non-homologous end joining protein LigD
MEEALATSCYYWIAMKSHIPFKVRPMLATLIAKPFHQPGWVYEEKYDGYRLIAYKDGNWVMLLSRNDKDRTGTFAEISEAIRKLPATTLVLDGEAVVFDRKGISRFQLLQQGGRNLRFAVFDCLYMNGRDLRKEALKERRTAMEAALTGQEKLFPSRRLPPNGLEAFEQAKKRGLEGIMAKEEASIYTEGRSKKWLKCKVHQEEEFVIGGYSAPSGQRAYFGALLLGAYGDEGLNYVGKVGTGFSKSTLESLHSTFGGLVRKRPPFVDPPRGQDITYLEPKLVAQIAFQEWTADNKLRQPVFLGLRDDKKPTECRMPE